MTRISQGRNWNGSLLSAASLVQAALFGVEEIILARGAEPMTLGWSRGPTWDYDGQQPSSRSKDRGSKYVPTSEIVFYIEIVQFASVS